MHDVGCKLWYTEAYLIGEKWKYSSGDGASVFMLSALFCFYLSISKFPDWISLLSYKKWGRSLRFPCTSLIPVRFTLFYLELISNLNSLKSGDSFAEP